MRRQKQFQLRTWGGDATCGKVDHREMFQARRLFEQVERSLYLLGVRVEFVLRHHARLADFTSDGTLVAHRLHDVTCARFSLGADESRALRYASKSLAEVARTANKRYLERVLVDLVFFIRGCQDF
jgi:hypothetical protein